MEPIQREVMLALAEIDELILANPTQSIKNIYNQKEIDLVAKFGASLVATHWPEFESKDSAYFAHKNKILLKLPQNIDDLKDLPSHYQQTTTKQRFLASPIDLMCKYLSIHKKIVDLGLKTIYSGKNHNEDFTVWVRMLMAFPFLMMNDIDEVWDEMIDSKPILDADDESKVTFILCFK